MNNYKKLGITSVAFPWMGAMNGGIPVDVIKSLMRKYLSSLDDINIEVYEFDPDTPCGLYCTLKSILDANTFSLFDLERMSGIKARYWIKIIDAVKDNNTKSINNLCHYIVGGKRIIGKTNIERLFAFLIKYKNTILY